MSYLNRENGYAPTGNVNGVVDDTALDFLTAEIVKVLPEIVAEFKRAATKHGPYKTPASPVMSNEAKLPILGEEFGEVCRAMTYDEGSPEKLDAELIQTATMAVAWVVGNRLRRIAEEV